MAGYVLHPRTNLNQGAPRAGRRTDGDIGAAELRRRIRELEHKLSEMAALPAVAGRTERELRERSQRLESRVQLLEHRQWWREMDRENASPD